MKNWLLWSLMIVHSCPIMAQDDTLLDNGEQRIFHYGLGIHVLGTSSWAVQNVFELQLREKISITPSLAIGVSPNWTPPTFEIITKTRFDYFIWPFLGVSAGGGFEQRFNPWYMNDPTSHDFIQNCTFGICPTAIREYFIDLGVTFKFLKNRKLVFSPLFTYIFNHMNAERMGPILTLELNYQLR